MRVDPSDGRCRTCGSVLEITDADDATLTVECTNRDCSDSYLLEPDALGDGAMQYYPEAIAKKLREDDAA